MNARASRVTLFGSLAACLTFVVVTAATVRADEPAREMAIATAFDATDLAWGACPPLFPEGCEIAVLHGDPARPNADIFYRVPSGYEIPRHWHSSAERMVLVTGELHVTYDGQDTAVMTPGTYAYGPARAPHSGTCVSNGPCLLFIAFEGPIDAHAADAAHAEAQ